MTIILVLLSAIAVAGLVAAYVYFFGELAQRHRGIVTHALDRAANSELDRAILPLETAHPNATGLRLLADNLAAFRARLDSARAAGRSLDLQYYYWKGDLTGRLLCRELISAADRGVRVRLLLDDINSSGFDSSYLALDSHAGIEVRLFNPSRSRSNAFRRGLELIVKYFTATRRMHNKCWIADGRLAIIGGRNIGDAYFDAAEGANFRDIDFLVAGKAVRDAEAIFDRYWNSDAALPIRSLHKLRRPKLRKLIFTLKQVCDSQPARDYVKLCDGNSGDPRMFSDGDGYHWTGDAQVIADPPEKAMGRRTEEWLGNRIDSLLQSARAELRITSPYFIPGRAGSETLQQLSSLGVDVRVLTNSLAATDVMAVHGAYAKYRRKLVERGIYLYELRPDDGRQKASLFGSSTASLHTKALVIDGASGFVGSFNLDPRSASINTEMGILFRDTRLAADLENIFRRQTRPQTSFQISVANGRLVWTDEVKGAERKHFSEPGSPWRRIIAAKLIGLLPIESQL